MTRDDVLEELAGNYVALYAVRRALVDLWGFLLMEQRHVGWNAAEVLRLEEIRQMVEAQKDMLPVSADVARQAQALLDAHRLRNAKVSPREKSEPNEHSNSTALIPRSQPTAPPPAIAEIAGNRYQEYRAGKSAAAPAEPGIPARRSAPAPRKTARSVRSGGKKRRRRRRPS